jgi:hypothetical protein
MSGWRQWAQWRCGRVRIASCRRMCSRNHWQWGIQWRIHDWQNALIRDGMTERSSKGHTPIVLVGRLIFVAVDDGSIPLATGLSVSRSVLPASRDESGGGGVDGWVCFRWFVFWLTYSSPVVNRRVEVWIAVFGWELVLNLGTLIRLRSIAGWGCSQQKGKHSKTIKKMPVVIVGEEDRDLPIQTCACPKQEVTRTYCSCAEMPIGHSLHTVEYMAGVVPLLHL